MIKPGRTIKIYLINSIKVYECIFVEMNNIYIKVLEDEEYLLFPHSNINMIKVEND